MIIFLADTHAFTEREHFLIETVPSVMTSIGQNELSKQWFKKPSPKFAF